MCVSFESKTISICTIIWEIISELATQTQIVLFRELVPSRTIEMYAIQATQKGIYHQFIIVYHLHKKETVKITSTVNECTKYLVYEKVIIE